MGLVVPAVLPSSQADLREKLARFAAIPAISRIQIDVVDGRFATPTSWPYTMPKDLSEMAEKGRLLPYLDRVAYEIDLMCLDAERAAAAWLTLGASRLTFHAETLLNIPKSLARMKERYGDVSASFGLALNIASEFSLIEPALSQIEYVQFMGIASIGKQGQIFDRRALMNVRAFHARHPQIAIQVDGGVTEEVARELIALGVTNLVVGSALLRAADPALEFEKLESLVSPFGV
jgi:ribulose-phosphate 3-epimerase